MLEDVKKSYEKRASSVVPNWKYLYYGITFQSSWELAVWIYCIDHNIPIIRDPCMFEYKDFENSFHKYNFVCMHHQHYYFDQFHQYL